VNSISSRVAISHRDGYHTIKLTRSIELQVMACVSRVDDFIANIGDKNYMSTVMVVICIARAVRKRQAREPCNLNLKRNLPETSPGNRYILKAAIYEHA